MSAPYITVIIPTFNRADKLQLCLESLQNQSLQEEAYEVIVVDDGSTDSTPELLKKWSEEWPRLRCIHQKNAGQGNARNKAIKEARGQIILFIGDDIYASHNFLLEHAHFHQDNPEETAACLGLTEWYGEVTPFMEWLTHGGPQFAYHHLKPGMAASFWYFYTSNLSIKNTFLGAQPFDPDFKAYGWEDIELGYRLEKQGLKLIYTPQALAHHDHFTEESSLKKRMRGVGKTAVLFQKKQPEIKVLPTGLKKLILRIITLWPFILLSIPFRRFHWYLLSKRYFIQGMDSI